MATEIEPLFEHRRWTVQHDPDDDTYIVWDHDGELADEAMLLEDAIAACREAADESYRLRLWDAIQDADPDAVPIPALEAICTRLGLHVELI